jgi:hypothetical protein
MLISSMIVPYRCELLTATRAACCSAIRDAHFLKFE